MVDGARIGAYRVLQRIGAGGMGEVWLAEHDTLGRRAAVKVLHAALSVQPETVARFFNEARAASAIADPGIVQIFDYGQHEGNAYIVMELLDGEPLDARLRRVGPLALGAALRITRQLASSLEAAHSRGIVHRDLKPENIFMVRDTEVAGGERAKILDFGIAKLTGDAGVKTQTSALLGTPMYMSPEQCRGAGLVDRRSDIYSLGCVLFTLLTGRPPFEAEGAGDLIAMHLRETAPAVSSRVPSVPSEVDALVARCLAKDPSERFGSCVELASAVAALAGRMSDGDLAGQGGVSGMFRPSAEVASSGAERSSANTRVSAGFTLRMNESGSTELSESGPGRATTSSEASGEARALPSKPRRSLIAALAGLVAAGGVVAIIVLRGTPASSSGTVPGLAATPGVTAVGRPAMPPAPPALAVIAAATAPIVPTTPTASVRDTSTTTPAQKPDGVQRSTALVSGAERNGAVEGGRSAHSRHSASKHSVAASADASAGVSVAVPVKRRPSNDEDIPDTR